MTRIRAAAGVILRDRSDRVLVVHPTYKDVWEVPGGTVKPGESPADARTREIRKEVRGGADEGLPGGAAAAGLTVMKVRCSK